jgi:hypothetical protein
MRIALWHVTRHDCRHIISVSGEVMHMAFLLLLDALKRIISQVSARDMV